MEGSLGSYVHHGGFHEELGSLHEQKELSNQSKVARGED